MKRHIFKKENKTQELISLRHISKKKNQIPFITIIIYFFLQIKNHIIELLKQQNYNVPFYNIKIESTRKK